MGHAGPARRLGGALVRRGHHVVEFGPDLRPTDVPPDPDSQGLRLPVAPYTEPSGRTVRTAAALAETANGAVGPVSDALLAAGVDVVISDVGLLASRIAARWLGLPGIASRPTFPVMGNSLEAGNTPAHPDHQERVARWQRSRDEIWRDWGVDIGDHVYVDATLDDRSFVYTTPQIVGEPELGDSVRFVGPLMGTASDATEPLLERWGDEPLVYVAFGTVYNDRKELFLAILEALADLPVRVLVSTWGRFTADDLAPVPANARIAASVDSRAVLREARLHITHGGSNSLHESLVEAVPMLCFPPGRGGAALWAGAAEAIGAAEIQRDHSADAIRAAVSRLLDDDVMQRRVSDVARSLAAYDGAAVASQAVDELVSGI
jgi:MGT family glycosyltransferase